MGALRRKNTHDVQIVTLANKNTERDGLNVKVHQRKHFLNDDAGLFLKVKSLVIWLFGYKMVPNNVCFQSMLRFFNNYQLPVLPPASRKSSLSCVLLVLFVGEV